jgi:hypothetical protein
MGASFFQILFTGLFSLACFHWLAGEQVEQRLPRDLHGGRAVVGQVEHAVVQPPVVNGPALAVVPENLGQVAPLWYVTA